MSVLFAQTGNIKTSASVGLYFKNKKFVLEMDVRQVKCTFAAAFRY